MLEFIASQQSKKVITYMLYTCSFAVGKGLMSHNMLFLKYVPEYTYIKYMNIYWAGCKYTLHSEEK